MAKGREFLTLLAYGVSADTIAQRSGLSRSFVYYALNLARGGAAGERPGSLSAPIPQSDSSQPGNVEPDAPPEQTFRHETSGKPRKLSEGTLLRRAYNAIRNVRAFKGLLDAETREFWVETLIEIRDLSDDGIHMTFGELNDVYTSRAEFLDVFGVQETHLAKLFRHNMLVDLDGDGIAMPLRWGLRGNPYQQPLPPRSARQRPLPFPFQVVKGGPPESEETPILSDSMSKETAIYSDSNSEETPILSDSAGVAQKVGGGGLSILNQSITTTTNQLSSARESERIAVESEETPPVESEEIKLQRLLPSELAARANLAGPPSAADVGIVQQWLDAGLTAGFMAAVIDGTMKNLGDVPPQSLKYFDKAMRRAIRAKSGKPPSSPATMALPLAASPLSLDDPLKQDLSKRWDRWRDSGSRGPMPPLIDALRPYLGKHQEAMARRWLAVFDAWHAAGHPHDARPPEFADAMRDPEAMEADMLACEDALSRPDDADG